MCNPWAHRPLAKNGVNPNRIDKDGQTPLGRSTTQGHDTVFRLLLSDVRVDPDSQDSKGWPPLLLSAMNGHNAAAKLRTRLK